MINKINKVLEDFGVVADADYEEISEHIVAFFYASDLIREKSINQAIRDFDKNRVDKTGASLGHLYADHEVREIVKKAIKIHIQGE